MFPSHCLRAKDETCHSHWTTRRGILLSSALAAHLVLAPAGFITPSATGQPAQFMQEAAPTEPTDPNHDEPSPDVHRRDTSACPFRFAPPPPVDSSEVPTPGATSPAPLPVPDIPAGGTAMSECDVIEGTSFKTPEDVAASSWIVFDVKTGDVLAAKDPHGRYRPASVIKVLLALVALEELDLKKSVRATYEDAAIEGSRVGIVEGVEYSVETLLTGLLLNSGNDCGHALSRMLGGMDATVEKVNAKAAQLGATDTRIFNPTGLDAPGQITSAFDMALFFRAAFSNPTYLNLSGLQLAKIPGNKELVVDDFDIANDNQLLSSGFEGALGGKTGFTDDARHTFAGVAERNGRRLGTILLDTTVHEAPRPWEQAADLLESGFDTPRETSIASLDTQAKGDETPQLPFFGTDKNTDPSGPMQTENSWPAIGIGVGIAVVVCLAAVITVAAGKRRR